MSIAQSRPRASLISSSVSRYFSEYAGTSERVVASHCPIPNLTPRSEYSLKSAVMALRGSLEPRESMTEKSFVPNALMSYSPLMAARAPAEVLSIWVVVGLRSTRVSDMMPVRSTRAVVSSGTMLCLRNC